MARRATCLPACACSSRPASPVPRRRTSSPVIRHDLDLFIGPATRVVAISTHNPLGVTFAAGVYTSIFGESKQPINSHYARELFDRVKNSPYRALSEMLLDKSPIQLPYLSTHPEARALVPLIGLETGSVRLAKQIMPSKGVPFPIDEWPSVVVNGLEILNRNNWFPAITLIIGSPGETDDDTRATLDLIYEVERRGLFAFFIPSVFTPLHDTRLEHRDVTLTAGRAS